MNPSGASSGWVLLLVATLIAAGVFAASNRRRGARLAVNIAGTAALACGLVTVGLAAAHLFFVVRVALARAPVSYDFRLYSLLLLGVLLAGLGLALALAAAGVARADTVSLRRATHAALVLLAVNLPLAPIQGLAVVLSILSATTLVPLFIARRRAE